MSKKPYNVGIAEDIIEEQFKKWFGKDFKLLVQMRYQDFYGKTPIEIVFTEDDKALWIAKYKDDYYGNAITGIEEKDKYSMIDVFYNLRSNALETLKEVRKNA